MSKFGTAIAKAKDTSANSALLRSLAFQINMLAKKYDFTTELQAAVTVAGFATTLDGLALPPNDRAMAHHLGRNLVFAKVKQLIDDDDIAACTTINTVAANTDLLYGLVTARDSTLDATTGKYTGGSYHPHPTETANI